MTLDRIDSVASSCDPHWGEQSGPVHALVRAARLADQVSPINELGAFALQGQRGGRHWLQYRGDHLVGWAWRDPDDASVQLVVHPDYRRQGLATRLADRVQAEASPAHWWAFGTVPGAQALARQRGLRAVRQLLIMSRDLDKHPVEPTAVGGTTITRLASHEPSDAEVDEVVAVNAAAFAHHPEQGAMTAADVRLKLDSDPSSTWLLARSDDSHELLGFHWTKLPQPTVGEVHVIAVSPAHSGRGLGRHLLNLGLAHLARQGAHHVHLYVEADQTRVVKLYHSASFEVITTDSSYA